MTALYADLSHHDWDRVSGRFDWPRIRAATSRVVCLRVSYGDPSGYNPTTRHAGDMARGARAAGIDTIGGYHNLIHGDAASINRQVDYLRRELNAVGAVWAMLDVERYPELLDRGIQPRYADARAFCDRWHAVEQRRLLVYLPKWIWDGHMGRPDLRVLGCPLVASDYGSNPDGSPVAVYGKRGGDAGKGWAAYGGVNPAVWQFGSNVDCPGASGATDINAYRGTVDQLRTLLTGHASTIQGRDTTDVEQTEPLKYETDSPTRKVGNVLADVANLRNYEVAPANRTTKYDPPAGSRISRLMALPDQVAALTTTMATLGQRLGQDLVDEDAIVQGVLTGLGTRPAAEVAAALVAAGQDPAALAAELSRLANPAEPS